MRFTKILLLSAVGCWLFAGQQTSPPQRTINTTPEKVSSDTKATAAAQTNPSAAVEQYREMWQKMTPAQQKAIVSAGGPTPDQYERMFTRATGAAGAQGAKSSSSADSGRTADPGALDSLSKSLQDLNAIRDGNLSLVQKDTCAPELASRIADLKARLWSYELDLNGAEASPAPRPAGQPSESGSSVDPMAIAGDWFKNAANAKASAQPDNSSHARESALLDAVLAQRPEPPERRVDPKSPEAELNRKEMEADVTRVKAELEQLSTACAAGKR